MKEPIIFKEGLKYTLRQYYTVATLAGLFGCATAILAFKSVAWATHRVVPREKTS
jgi:hypothetical protein